MHPNVLPTLRRVLGEFEGVHHSMYVDSHGLVTVGIGFLIDPFSEALALGLANWSRRGGGGPVTAAELRDEWDQVKGRARDYQCRFILSNTAIETLFRRKATNSETVLRRLFSHYDNCPADAQLGMLCVTWVRGSVAGMQSVFPEFIRCCTSRDWQQAGGHSLWAEIRTATGGPQDRRVRRRNAMLRMFDNAAMVKECNDVSAGSMPVQRLHFPMQAQAPNERIAYQVEEARRQRLHRQRWQEASYYRN